MANPHLTIERAAALPGEEVYLSAVVDDLSDHQKKLAYADWLERQGDERAEFLRVYAKACESMDPADFPKLRGVDKAWARTVGAALMQALAKNGLAEHCGRYLPLVKPALLYKTKRSKRSGRSFRKDGEIPVGGTKMFGLPDLPDGASWPRQRDCNTFYMEDSGIDPDTPCGFVCQISFAELAGTQAARRMPDHGLLSIFACAEVDSIGMIDGLVIFTPDTSNLSRLEAPAELLPAHVEANALRDAQPLTLSESLALPAPDDESPFEVMRWTYEEAYDAYSEMLHQAEANEHDSILGYTRPTTSCDPLPGEDWCKLLTVDDSLGIRMHFCIRNDDLAAAKFDKVKLAFVDFD